MRSGRGGSWGRFRFSSRPRRPTAGSCPPRGSTSNSKGDSARKSRRGSRRSRGGAQPTRRYPQASPSSRSRPVKKRLILVMGVAGSGKSELARAILEQIPAVYLDNNFLADAFSPGSRSDERYLAVRDNLYTALYRITRENLRIGNSVLLDAPHIRQAQDPEWCRWIQDLAA